MSTFRVLGLLALLPVTAASQDASRGRDLYERYCFDCHYPHVHELPRGRSEVENLKQLRELVATRATLTKHRFSDQEKADVVEYLNQSYYRFSK